MAEDKGNYERIGKETAFTSVSILQKPREITKLNFCKDSKYKSLKSFVPFEIMPDGTLRKFTN